MNASRAEVFVEGVALNIGWRDGARNLSELIFDTVRGAIDDAGRGLDGIDSVVLAAHDLVDGRSLSSMVTAPAAGAYLRDEVRYGDDGAAAFAAAVMRLEGGESERSIVAAWGRSSEHNVEAVSRSLFDPFFAQPFGIEEAHVSGLRAQSWMKNGATAARSLAIARRNGNADANPRALKSGGHRSSACYPLTDDDMPVWADVFVAAVVSTQPARVKVAGLGQSSEPFWIGDRKLIDLTSLRLASQRAFDEANVVAGDLDVIEVDGLTLLDEAMALEAIGAASAGQGLDCLAGDPRCNPSGGGAGGYCAPAMGLARIVEAALQLRGQAGAVQRPKVERAMATGSSIVAAQTQTAVILEAV